MSKVISYIMVMLICFYAVGCTNNPDKLRNNEKSAIGTTEIIESSEDEVQQEKDSRSQNREDQANDENIDQKDNNTKALYINASRLYIRELPSNNSRKIGSLLKGTRVQVLEERRQDSEDGKYIIWNNIIYKMGDTEKTGWVHSKYLSQDRREVLESSLKSLDFSPQKKVDEHSDNQRVKVKGIYVSRSTAGGSELDRLIEMAKRTEINAFVIDVKDDSGFMLFPTKAAEKFCPGANEKALVDDIGSFMKKLKDNNIYTIARIVSFKDPTYAKHYPQKVITYKDTGKPFTNGDKMLWVSPYDRQLWEYNTELSKEAAKAGFNEIQFDYVRFPASNGGKLDSRLDYKNVKGESKPQAIQEYLKYAYTEISSLNAYISADVYGLVGTALDDMGLGQYWEGISNVVDYISPMIYPSHYGNGSYGLSIPDRYPYETVLNCVRDALYRNNNISTPAYIRPWIQDFTATWVEGHIPYNEKEVRAQIKALKDSGIEEYLLWNARNVYTESALTD